MPGADTKIFGASYTTQKVRKFQNGPPLLLIQTIFGLDLIDLVLSPTSSNLTYNLEINTDVITKIKITFHTHFCQF